MTAGERSAYAWVGGAMSGSGALNVYWSITRPSALCAFLAGVAAGMTVYYAGRALRG